MPTDSDKLAKANACHDDDVAQAAQWLRDIDGAALDADERPLLAFLLNHVLGEKCGQWAEAQSRTAALLAVAGADAAPVLWRQAAVAASLAGDDVAAQRLAGALAARAGVDALPAQQLVALSAAAFFVPDAAAAAAGRRALDALAPLDAAHWQQPSALDAAAAAACNNIAAELAERAPEDLREAELRAALMRAALLSQRLWTRCGDWVNRQRACYGVAVAAAALGECGQARDAAQQGLALLDRHDSAGAETVDRAFLELELSFACRGLAHDADAAAARARADALAAAFDDGLRDWYAQRCARHAQLAGR